MSSIQQLQQLQQQIDAYHQQAQQVKKDQQEELNVLYKKYDALYGELYGNIEQSTYEFSTLAAQIVNQNNDWETDKDTLEAIFNFYTFMEEPSLYAIDSDKAYLYQALKQRFAHPLVEHIEGALIAASDTQNGYLYDDQDDDGDDDALDFLVAPRHAVSPRFAAAPRFHVVLHKHTPDAQIASLSDLLDGFIQSLQAHYLDTYQKDYHVEIVVSHADYPLRGEGFFTIKHVKDNTYTITTKVDRFTHDETPIASQPGTLEEVIKNVHTMMFDTTEG